jgi:hypothetical protein
MQFVCNLYLICIFLITYYAACLLSQLRLERPQLGLERSQIETQYQQLHHSQPLFHLPTIQLFLLHATTPTMITHLILHLQARITPFQIFKLP